jgi:hypothetical protein
MEKKHKVKGEWGLGFTQPGTEGARFYGLQE